MRRAAVLALLAAALLCGPAAATVPGAAQDVRLLGEQMEAHHPDLFHSVSRADFRAAVDSLAARADSLGPNELLVELMKLGALPGERDGHTGLFPFESSHRDRPHFFPIRLYSFPEGLFVVGQSGASDLIGARLVAINGTPVEQVQERVRPLVPRDNEWSLRARVPLWVVVAEVLDGLGIARGGVADFAFVLRGGSARTVRLGAVDAESYLAAAADVFHPMIPLGLPRRARPIYLAHRNDEYWLGRLNRGTVVYLAYNQTTFGTSTLARRLLRLAKKRRVRRVVVDIRHNPGGDNGTYPSLVNALAGRTIGKKRLFVLIGRTTFSAAAHFATEVDLRTKATFVGEPTGGAPDQYGDPTRVDLPASGWTVNIATVHWEKDRPGQARLAIEPDVPVQITAADFFAGRDPVLKAALR